MADYDYRQVCKNAAMACTHEQRQEFLDCMWNGMKLGDARKNVGISFEAALGTMSANITSRLTLRRQSI